jgi:hypothetical protein
MEPYYKTKKTLYHRINTSIFHNVSARVFSLWSYNRFGLDIVTSDYWIVIAVLITILFFVVMRKNKELPRRIMNEAEKKRKKTA